MTKTTIPKKYINIVQDKYREVKTNIRTCGGATQDFSITIGLHEVSTISPFLFAMVLHKIARSIQRVVSWFMLFSNDIALVDETRERINAKLEQHRQE